KPGDQVLDIATGRGEPAVRAAARVAPDGAVLGTDISDEMLDFARARAAAQSVSNLRLLVTSGESLTGVPDQTFDAALCRWGLMSFDPPVEPLQAARRCLNPGGGLVAALWAEPERTPCWSMPRAVLARQIPQPPVDASAPGPFHYAAPAAFRADLARA